MECDNCHLPMALDELEQRLERMFAEHEAREQQGVDERMQKIMRAFPGGIDEHFTVHCALAKAAKAQEDFYREIKIDLAKNGLWALLKVLLALAILGIASKMGFHLGA